MIAIWDVTDLKAVLETRLWMFIIILRMLLILFYNNKNATRGHCFITNRTEEFDRISNEAI